MEKIKEYINKEMKDYSNPNLTSENNNKINKKDPNSKLKEDFEIWLENLNRSMYLSKFRQVLGEIEYGKKNFDSIPTEHWRYKIIQLKAIFHIIKIKIHKYPFEISKENSRQSRSILFWFNQSFLILEQLILLFREDLNYHINLKSKEVLKPIQYIYLGQIELLYLLVNYSYINGEIPTLCSYLSMVDRLASFSGYTININISPILQKIYLFRVKLCIANCDFINGLKYVKKTIDLCADQLLHTIDYDLDFDNLDNYEKDAKNPFNINRMNKKVIEEIIVNISLAFYLRGVISELLGNVTKAIDSYKQAKFFATKFLRNKYYNFSMFFKAMQNNGYIYASVMDELKELKEQKQEQAKIENTLLLRKKYFQKLKYQKNYNKYYSNITTKQNLYKGNLKKFLDHAGDILYKEEQNRYSILKKFSKTNYITSTIKMINNLLSKDFKSVLERMDKVELTKPSVELNGLINRALLKRRQIQFNQKNEEKKKNKENVFNKKTQSTNINTYGDIRSKTLHSAKNKIKQIDFRNNNDLNFYLESNNNSTKVYKLKQRPLSGFPNKSNIFYRIRNKYYKTNKKTRNNSAVSMKVKNRMNKSEESSLDTIDNENSNKLNFILDNYNYNNSLSIAKNSFNIKSNSAVFQKRKNKNNNISFYNSNYNSNYEKNYSGLFQKRFNYSKNLSKNRQKNKSYIKISLKPKKEFRIDKENFAKDYINKKIFLDKYCNEEIKFHRKLLSSKSCEVECTKEPNEFDLKKCRRDADMAFNKIFELCKSSSNKKNISKYLKQRKLLSGGTNINLTTSSDKKVVYSLYEVFRDNKTDEDRVLDEKEKKIILLKNEEKMKELNMEYEKMIQKESEIKEKKIKLLEEIMGRK